MEKAYCGTVPNNKKITIWYLSLITRNSSRASLPLSGVNVTGLLRRLQNNNKNMETSLKSGFAQLFSCCPKIWVAPNFFWGGGGDWSSPRPPARTTMEGIENSFFSSRLGGRFRYLSHKFNLFYSSQSRSYEWILIIRNLAGYSALHKLFQLMLIINDN